MLSRQIGHPGPYTLMCGGHLLTSNPPGWSGTWRSRQSHRPPFRRSWKGPGDVVATSQIGLLLTVLLCYIYHKLHAISYKRSHTRIYSLGPRRVELHQSKIADRSRPLAQLRLEVRCRKNWGFTTLEDMMFWRNLNAESGPSSFNELLIGNLRSKMTLTKQERTTYKIQSTIE